MDGFVMEFLDTRVFAALQAAGPEYVTMLGPNKVERLQPFTF